MSRVNAISSYCVTWQAQGFKNNNCKLVKGVEIATRLGKLRQDIWHKYWEINHDCLYQSSLRP